MEGLGFAETWARFCALERERRFTPRGTYETRSVAEPRFNAGAAGDGELLGRS